MKTTMKNYMKIFFPLVFVLAIACGEPDYPTPTPVVTTLTSKLTVVHAMPGGPKAKVKIDNKITEKDTVRFEPAGDNKLYNTITLSVPAGPGRLINFANASDNKDLVVDRYAATSGTNNTSFFIYKKDATSGLYNVNSVARVADDLAAPDPGVAKVRFFHLAPGAGDLKVVNAADASTTFTIRAYADTKADFARFSTLPAGTYNFEVKPSTPADSVVFTINSLKLDSKGIYTIYAKGLPNATDEQKAEGLGISYSVIKH
jgi:hypothetical protein